MKKSLIAFVLALSVASCSKKSNDNILIQGKVERDELAIVGKIAGRIDKILVQEGDFVKKGDTLAILDIPELVAKKAQAKGAVKSAAAQYDMSVQGARSEERRVG